MYGQHHPKRKLVDDTYPRINITDYVQTFAIKLRKREGRPFDTRDLRSAMLMADKLNDPRNTEYKSVRDIRTEGFYWGNQRVDLVPSNFGQGRGYIFYFRCNGCGRRVKYLYEYTTLESPLCRICCRLNYRVPSRKARDLSRLIRMPYLSSEAKHALIKRAGLTVQDILDSEK